MRADRAGRVGVVELLERLVDRDRHLAVEAVALERRRDLAQAIAQAGGAAVLEEAFGKDATALFDKYHKYVNGEYIMRATRVGVMPGYVGDSDSD